MGHDYLDFDIAIARAGEGYTARVLASPAGEASAPFALPFGAADLAQFMVAVGPPRVSSRRLVPAAARVVDVKDYGTRLGQALLTGDVDAAFRQSLATATAQGKDLRVRLRLDGAPDLDPVPWEYLYDTRLDRFLTLSQETPLVRLMESLERPPVVTVDPPLRVLVMISSPTDMPELAVEREEQLLRATTGDLVKSGQLELVVLADATLSALQRALIDEYHVFHFIGHGGFDTATQEGVLVLEREDGTAHRVSASRLGTLLHDARAMQLAVLNACEGARSSGRDAFSGVAQELVRRGLPAVVAMQTEISDRAALVFTHEFYWFLTKGLPIDAAMCEVRKAMATSDEASEWGTAVLLRSGADQPFAIRQATTAAAPAREQHWESLYEGAQGALAANAPGTALTMLEQLEAERPGYADVTELIERVRPELQGPPDVRAEPIARPVGGEPAPPHPAPGQRWGTPPDGAKGAKGADDADDADDEPGNSGRQRRNLPVWLRVIGGLVAVGAALFMILVFIEALRGDPGDGASPSAEVTAGPTTGPTTEPTTDPTNDATAAPDALTLACGPAPESDTPLAVGALPVGCATTRPEVDGDFAEWVDLPVIVVTDQVAPVGLPNADEFGSLWHAQWDREALYLHAEVTDLAITPVDMGQPGQFWRGDSISFEFGPDARDLDDDAPLRDGSDRHVMIGVTADGAAAAVNVAVGGSFRAGPLVPAITAVAIRTDVGYSIEARIPWVTVGVDPPSRGEVFAANLNVSDAATTGDWALARMISSNPDRTGANQPHPGTWQWLVLGDGVTAVAGRLYALLVGIDAYPAPVPPLGGCVNDVTAIGEVLAGRVPAGTLALRVLTNEAATRDAVVAGLRDHLGQAGPDDVALFYYSGHGSQQEAPAELWPGEPDHRNETLVLVDSRLPGRWDLADKELAVLLGAVATGGGHVVTVLDCCHSGGGTRDAVAGARLRQAPIDERVRPFDTFLPGTAAVAAAPLPGTTDGATRSLEARWGLAGSQVLLAACRSSETAKEVAVAGRGRGALSAALEAALRDGGQLTYRQLHRHVTAAVMRRVEGQHPQVEAPDPTDLDRAFLGGAVPPAPRELTLSHLPDGWSIDAGAVHGVPGPVGEDSTDLAIRALGSATTLATATVTSVLTDRSLVRLSTPLDTAFVYRAVVTSIPLRPLGIGVVGADADTVALRAAVAAADPTLVALGRVETADVVVEATTSGFAITRPGVTRPLVPVVAGERREERTAAALEHVARWLRLAALHNPATRLREGSVALAITAADSQLGDDGRIEIAYADRTPPAFSVTLRNTTDTPLWCALIDLTETYGIFTDAFPAGSVALAPGESTTVVLAGQVSDALWAAGTVTVTDQLKVVTSTLEFDPRSLQQEELDVAVVGGAPVVRGGGAPRSTLERLLGRVVTRRLGPPSPTEAVADWRTDDVFVLTTRPRD